MAKKSYARRYAEAIFEIARGQQKLDAWQNDLNKIAGLAADSQVIGLIENPRLHPDERLRLLKEYLVDVSDMAVNLAQLLVEKGLMRLAAKISAEYRGLVYSFRGIEPAEVITAIELADEDRQALLQRLSKMLDKKIILTARTDPAILGGIVVKVGGKLIDGSTRTKLQLLKQELASGT